MNNSTVFSLQNTQWHSPLIASCFFHLSFSRHVLACVSRWWPACPADRLSPAVSLSAWANSDWHWPCPQAKNNTAVSNAFISAHAHTCNTHPHNERYTVVGLWQRQLDLIWPQTLLSGFRSLCVCGYVLTAVEWWGTLHHLRPSHPPVK